MNVVFINSLERKTNDNAVVSAQVSILEEHGFLRTVWSEPNDSGMIVDDQWYEGDSWEEMLAIFRYRLAEKMGAGFVPVVDYVPPEAEISHAGVKKARMLQYYSEHHRNEELYEALRLWRRDRAIQDSRIPYMIANNRLLTLISAFIPHTEEELLQIPGIGQHKLKSYGKEILDLTCQYEQKRGFPLDWIANAVEEDHFRRWLFKQQEVKLKAAADELMDKKKLLRGIAKDQTLSQLQAALSLPMRDVMGLLEQLEADGYDLLPMLEKELQAIPEEERNQVIQLFGASGDKYLKPIFEKVYADQQLSGEELEEVYNKLRLLRLYYRQTRHEATDQAVS